VFRVVIPARFASSRFPGKPLAMIGARPMIAWVVDCARGSKASEVIVATDDARIADAARAAGADVAMTSATHESGTDRIAEVARARAFASNDIVVNVQGDEPRMPATLIDAVADAIARRAEADIATAAYPIESVEEYLDPNVVKVASRDDGMALYFSRAPIPFNRDAQLLDAADAAGSQGPERFSGARRHIGIYAYRAAALQRLAARPPTSLEQAEKLEQLRALFYGLQMLVVDTLDAPGPDVNVPKDVLKLR